MSNEDFERRMEFIVEQQAKNTVEIEKLTKQVSQLTGFAAILKDAFVSLTRHVERHDEQIARNEEQIAALIEQGRETDARLNALITIVERHVSGHP